MDQITDRFALPLLQPGQAQKELFHNEALSALDIRLHPVVETIGESDPPGAAMPGQCWIVGPSATGAWIGQEDTIAAMTAGGWRFAAPVRGMLAWVNAAATWAIWRESHWNIDEFPVRGISVGGQRVVGERQPAIADPIGGTTVDNEARTALAALLETLRNHGLITT